MLHYQSSFVEVDYVVVLVEDSGAGINKAGQQKISERFYRVRVKSEKTYPGFGTGLFLCSKLIQRHEGKIGFPGEPGKVAAFYFSNPLKKKY